MAIVSLTLTVVDSKDKESTMTIYTTDNWDLTALVDAALQFAQLTANIIRGRIKAGSLCLNLDVNSLTNNTLPAAPNDNVDVEEGAIFIWETAAGTKFPKRNRVPTFDESLVLSGSQDVDINDADVLAFYSAMSAGLPATDGQAASVTVTFNDSRGEDITILREAYESFQSSRKRD